ncbi:arsenic transporter [Paenisporosarcina antarctica]|uniref:Arsenic transporter n=1 Tax=Paenisporosarcina antarctica TaxID=417367 RepID=A0A4V1ANI1_9BACL|nr:arsenic transporter [Paenisporosarcina antarctica]QBP42855.1 arsenic transporter [Paenisporosarcina antarctica]
MHEYVIIYTFTIFALTTLFIMWRPWGINESIPAISGAILLFIAGVVPFSDILQIFKLVSGPSITIISTIIMCIVLESIGVFRWAAVNIVNKAKGSGKKLFMYVMFLCFLMTIFFNNDGSILITTPIIIHIVFLLHLKPRQKLPYLFAGVFIATAASLPIGVSNIANLIGLKMVGLDLISYTRFAFVPSMIGITTLCLLLYHLFKKDIPKNIATINDSSIEFLMSKQSQGANSHPLSGEAQKLQTINWALFKICIIIVVLIRGSYFILPSYGVPIEVIAITGAVILIVIRWISMKVGIKDVAMKAPWHILVFAFGMYVTVYSLNNTGITVFFISLFESVIKENLVFASFITGIFISVLSNLMNNLPSVMLGTLIITDMGLDIQTLQVSYIAIIIGSDIGALLSPLGTLATLLWMFVLRKNGIYITWSKYFKVALLVIPMTLFVTLIAFNLWLLFIL